MLAFLCQSLRIIHKENINNLARSANLPEGLYISPMFFLYFLTVDFLAPVAQMLMEQSSPNFQDW